MVNGVSYVKDLIGGYKEFILPDELIQTLAAFEIPDWLSPYKGEDYNDLVKELSFMRTSVKEGFEEAITATFGKRVTFFSSSHSLTRTLSNDPT